MKRKNNTKGLLKRASLYPISFKIESGSSPSCLSEVHAHVFFKSLHAGILPLRNSLALVVGHWKESDALFLVSLNYNKKRKNAHAKKQTDASMEHLERYQRRICPHKGTFIGLPSFCGVQGQSLATDDDLIKSRGAGGGGGQWGRGAGGRGWRWWRGLSWDSKEGVHFLSVIISSCTVLPIVRHWWWLTERAGQNSSNGAKLAFLSCLLFTV